MKTQKIMNRSIYFLMALFFLFIGFIACSKSNEDKDKSANCDNWSEQYIAQANAYSATANVYTKDPTIANCQKYKAAGIKYIDALESAADCVPTANSKDFASSLNDYRKEVNGLNCN